MNLYFIYGWRDDSRTTYFKSTSDRMEVDRIVQSLLEQSFTTIDLYASINGRKPHFLKGYGVNHSNKSKVLTHKNNTRR